MQARTGRRSEVQDYPLMHGKFQTILDNMRPPHKKQKHLTQQFLKSFPFHRAESSSTCQSVKEAGKQDCARSVEPGLPPAQACSILRNGPHSLPICSETTESEPLPLLGCSQQQVQSIAQNSLYYLIETTSVSRVKPK